MSATEPMTAESMPAVTAPMRAQLAASDPGYSVWVAANAGTGKTKVLTDRVLRLLLAGTAPSRILCITYTKAAAAEMENRIHHTLSAWVALDDAALAKALRSLNDHPPSEEMIRRARSLFAMVLDAPEGVRIQTIHSFCQSLLRRFPLEAGVQPHFEVIDDRTAMELLAEARMRLFSRSLRPREGDEALAEAITLLSARLAEGRFQELLQELVAERRNLLPALEREDGAARLIAAAYAALDMPQDMTEERLFAECFTYSSQQENGLRNCVKWLFYGGKTDGKYAELMQPWWQETGNRPKHWPEYRQVWLTSAGEPRKNIATNGVIKENPSCDTLLRAEQERCLRYEARLRALMTAQFTEAVIVTVDSMLSIYNHLKSIHQFLDYDDLVLLTLRLLRRDGIAPWVLFKLDGGLDHVLIDEAQDTSPEQWELVDLLVEEFFAGEGRAARIHQRTLFVVGDEKQSIYSFQGAAPRAFGAKCHDFARRAEDAKAPFRTVALSMSFRSTATVLDVVDKVISQPHVRAGMSFQGDIVPHDAYRSGDAGLVEIWPVIVSEPREQGDIWQVRQETASQQDAQYDLANRIAKTISGWLHNDEMLESQNRPVRAGDVLVLVRSRNSFMHHLVRALKRLDVPLAGVDRMALTENIAVMDLLALAEFLLLPEDDLSLACVLKSPLCGISEEQLFDLAYGREKQSLWSRLQASAELKPCAEFLSGLLERVDYIRPYELFAAVLEEQGKRQAFAQRMGSEVFDPLDEFLALALDYERSHAPSMQGFIHWLRSGETEVKRDMEQGRDAVRIMTVHGSKGLQAPIVFLPDTTTPPRAENRPLWTQHNGERVMLWSPSGAEDDPVTAQLRERHKQAQEEEYRRLLYVAMTRAEDRLYIAGALGRRQKDVPENCWYRWLVDGARELMQPHNVYLDGVETEILRYTCVQSRAAKQAENKAEERVFPSLPDAFRHPPAPEPYPPQPLVPSRSDELASANEVTGATVLSPVADSRIFRRGNLIHRLLQWLPDTEPETRRQTGLAYLARYAEDWQDAERQSLLAEVLAVLDDPAMAPVFASGSLAEVPLSGLIRMEQDAPPRLLSGQVDRLCVTGQGVWIVDYKTQRVPPARMEDVPAAYLRQMAVYRAALAQIYPDRPVHCALLWTATPHLMPLPGDVLDSLRLPGLISKPC